MRGLDVSALCVISFVIKTTYGLKIASIVRHAEKAGLMRMIGKGINALPARKLLKNIQDAKVAMEAGAVMEGSDPMGRISGIFATPATELELMIYL